VVVAAESTTTAVVMVVATDLSPGSPRPAVAPAGGPALRTERRDFRCMGTIVTLIAPDPPGRRERDAIDDALATVKRTFDREDERFSRFRAGTEISRVNAAAGSWMRVSKGFLEVLELALEAAKVTDGLFDPTVLPALLAAGYDADFDEVLAGARLALTLRSRVAGGRRSKSTAGTSGCPWASRSTSAGSPRGGRSTGRRDESATCSRGRWSTRAATCG
jgi:thiamine biosynthesis lipoprotein ApbE